MVEAFSRRRNRRPFSFQLPPSARKILLPPPEITCNGTLFSRSSWLEGCPESPTQDDKEGFLPTRVIAAVGFRGQTDFPLFVETLERGFSRSCVRDLIVVCCSQGLKAHNRLLLDL